MTDSGNAADHNLTEDAHAHGNAEGIHRRCNPAPVHIGKMEGWGKQEFMTGCPLLHSSLCRLNGWWEELEMAEARLATLMDRDCPDVDAIDYWTDRICRIEERMAPTLAEHQSLWDRHEKQLAHCRNAEKLHKGSWAFTLTYSPSKHGWDKEEAQAAMTEALRRLQHYYRNEIIEFHACGEYTQSGQPHVHGHYSLTDGKRMTTKNFKRAYPIWNPNHRIGKGHEGGYHEPAKSDSDYSGYIQKDLDDAWVVISYPNGPAEETSGAEAAGGGSAPTSGPPSPRASAESHDG